MHRLFVVLLVMIFAMEQFVLDCCVVYPSLCVAPAQAKEALQSPYFDDLDKDAVDALESDIIRAREG